VTPPVPGPTGGSNISVTTLAATLKRAVDEQEVCLMRLPLSWSGEMWDFRHPLDFLGYDGGGGIGSGPGMSIGSALALKGSDRLPIAVIGDGDYMMGVNALWTAANARIPMLMVVCNNRSFFNDEVHQERVARQRKRPIENRWIGQRISDPPPDLAMMARGQGLTGVGPVGDASELEEVLRDAIAAVKKGETVVVDVLVQTGYSPAMTAGLTRSKD
jgi:thiamine pyrophosphate-dependent acetolactate synthase large subunit-like protein